MQSPRESIFRLPVEIRDYIFTESFSENKQTSLMLVSKRVRPNNLIISHALEEVFANKTLSSQFKSWFLDNYLTRFNITFDNPTCSSLKEMLYVQSLAWLVADGYFEDENLKPSLAKILPILFYNVKNTELKEKLLQHYIGLLELSIENAQYAQILKDTPEIYGYYEKWQQHRNSTLDAVRNLGFSLEGVSVSLKNDREIVLAALQREHAILQEISVNRNRHILSALVKNGGPLQYASEDLKNDHEMVLIAVRLNGYALRHASESLKNNIEIASAAVKQNKRAIEYVPEAIRSQIEVRNEAPESSNPYLLVPR